MRLPELRRPVNLLVAFPYYRDAPLDSYVNQGMRLMGDSGAFSARTLGTVVDIGEFAEWCQRWRQVLFWIASLDDRVNEPEHCWGNYHRLRHHYGIDVVPTIHAGDNAPYWLDRYAGDGVDFVGLGGLVSHRTRPDATMPWLAGLFKHARDQHPTMRFHGWGVTNMRLLSALPYYSADSSNIGSSYRYAVQPLFDPRTGTVNRPRIGTKWRTTNQAVRGYHDLLSRVYGVNTEDCTTSTPDNRTMWIRLGVRSLQLTEDYLHARHGHIPAPRYGVAQPTPGIQMWAVDAAPANAHRLFEGAA